ncbi:uncharacterized protein LOC141604996 [Silene latifolia]|uniref:uncharacterized protein LOC141604996 n=1 Tax=Silene latifolia TaxID=37657 RepID=UPI003D77365D
MTPRFTIFFASSVKTILWRLHATGLDQRTLTQRNLLKGIMADENTAAHDINSERPEYGLLRGLFLWQFNYNYNSTTPVLLAVQIYGRNLRMAKMGYCNPCAYFP